MNHSRDDHENDHKIVIWGNGKKSKHFENFNGRTFNAHENQGVNIFESFKRCCN